MLADLLRGDEKKVWGDAGYQGQTEKIHQAAPAAQDMTCRRAKTKEGVDEAQRRKNRLPDRLCDPLHRRLRRLRHLHRRFDCYRVERSSSRMGLAPTVDQRLSRRT